MGELLTPIGVVEVGGERGHRGCFELRLSPDVAARGVDEQGAANRCIALILGQGDLLSCDVGEDDELDVASRRGTRLRSSRA